MCLIVIFVIFTAHRTAYNGGFQLLSLVCRSTYRADDDACARLSSRRLHFTWSQLHRLRVHYGWYVFDIIGEFFFLFPTLHGRVENKLSRLSVLFWWQKKIVLLLRDRLWAINTTFISTIPTMYAAMPYKFRVRET